MGSAKLAHGKSKWKLRKIIEQLKSTREGTLAQSEKIAIGRIEVTLGFVYHFT